MAILTGIARGTQQGLAQLSASKRLERQTARENRRYTNELLFRIGQAKAARADSEKRFAYQKTQDDIAHQQWAKEIGLKEATLNETIRAGRAHEEDVDLARQIKVDQFNKTLSKDIRQHEADIGMRRKTLLENMRQFDQTLQLQQQEHLDRVADQSLARRLQQDRDQRQSDYYDDIIRLREEELNRPLTDLERRQIEADINLKKSQADYYDQRPPRGGGTSTTPKPTWMQAGELGGTIAKEFAKRFADRGRSFTPNPWAPILEPGPQAKFPFTQSAPLPYDEGSGGKPGQPTQVSEMQAFGAEVFERLWRETGDVNLALQRLDTVYTDMLADEDYGGTVRNYMKHYGPKNAEQELRQYFLKGGLDALKRLRETATTPRTETESPAARIQIGPGF